MVNANELLIYIESHLFEIKTILSNMYNILIYFIVIFIIYCLYRFFSRFIFGGV